MTDPEKELIEKLDQFAQAALQGLLAAGGMATNRLTSQEIGTEAYKLALGAMEARQGLLGNSNLVEAVLEKIGSKGNDPPMELLT